jgi:hypothetical protein
MGTLKTTNIESISGSGTVTLGTSGETFTVPSGVTVNMSSATQTGVGGANTPAFAAYAPSDQDSLSSGTWTKLTMDAEFFDSDGKYDTSNYRFTPTVAGKYMFGAQIYADATNTNEESSLAFYKNGTRFLYKEESADNINTQQLTGVITLDSDDYVELYLKISVAGGGTFAMDMDGTTSNNRCYWYGYKLIGA